ncbi:MAG: hypothetical protein K2I29_05670, partial [Clostridia bacterium]|nr:hypothetical protein [Clostridia bacterium]
ERSKEGRKIQEEKNVKAALLKCDTGLSASEVVEEFAMVDGELTLVKKKVTKREVPPDIKAVKMLLEERGEASDEELEAERKRLLSLLDEQNFEGERNG